MSNAAAKAVARHDRKIARKGHPQNVPRRQPVPAGCGMGWPETKDLIAMQEVQKK